MSTKNHRRLYQKSYVWSKYCILAFTVTQLYQPLLDLDKNLEVVDYVAFQDEQVYLSEVWILTYTSGLKDLMSTRLVQVPTLGNTVSIQSVRQNHSSPIEGKLGNR